MSEVSDYERKVKTLTYAELQREVARWQKQQEEATGEYGYWGGVTGQEIAEAEIDCRSGKEYEVLKSFVDDDGIFRKSKTMIMENQLNSYMPSALEKHGFIKLKGDKSE